MVHGATEDGNGLREWFAEFRRVVAEAEERFMHGDLRPAMASLAAVPMIHSMLMQGCGELTTPNEAPEEDSGDEITAGLYL